MPCIASADCLQWHAGNLVGLNLTAMNLTCSLPTAQLSQFTALQSLSLSNNPNLAVSKRRKPMIADGMHMHQPQVLCCM